MIDKIRKIKDWISKTQDGLMDANGNFENPSNEGAFHILSNLDYYIDSLQEEPVNKNYRERYKRIAQSEKFKKTYEGMSVGEIMHVEGEEPVSEDLGEYINELSKQFPEVSFAKLSRIAVRVAKWQKEQNLELTWEDIKTIDKLLNQCVDYSNPYQEVLKRFNKERKEL